MRLLDIARWSIVRSLYLVKLDNPHACGHTQTTDVPFSPRTRVPVAPPRASARARARHSYRHRHSPPLGGDFAHAAGRRRIRRLLTGEVRLLFGRRMRESNDDAFRRYGVNFNTVACLAGDGVGPELMAAATRALDRVAKLHG